MNNYLAAKKGERRSQTSEIRQQKEKGRCQQAEGKEEVRNQITEGNRRKKEDIRMQRSERRGQKEANKDLQNAINSFIIH